MRIITSEETVSVREELRVIFSEEFDNVQYVDKLDHNKYALGWLYVDDTHPGEMRVGYLDVRDNIACDRSLIMKGNDSSRDLLIFSISNSLRRDIKIGVKWEMDVVTPMLPLLNIGNLHESIYGTLGVTEDADDWIDAMYRAMLEIKPIDYI